MFELRPGTFRGAGLSAGLAFCSVSAGEQLPDDVTVECTESYISVRATQVPVRRVLRELANRCDITVQLGVPLDEPTSIDIERLRPQRAARRLLGDYSFVLRYARPSPDAGNWLWIFGDRPQQTADEEIISPAATVSIVDKREVIYRLADDADALTMNYLRNALVDPDRDIREAAVETLAELGTDEAAESLAVALRDPDNEICQSALDALGQIGGSVALRLLREMLDTPDPLLREAAADNFEELNAML